MSTSQNRRYVLVQTVAPHYRQGFFDALADELEESLTILSGREYFDANLKSEVVNRRMAALVHNIFLFRRKMLFQWGVHIRAIQADVAVLEYNPRILNTWIVAIVRKALRRKTIMWGHVYSRRGSDNFARAFQRAFSNALIVYTEDQRQILSQVLKYKGAAHAAPNAIRLSKEMQPVSSRDRHSFLYVGRLVREKKPLLIISAFAAAVHALPETAMLIVVGIGPERSAMLQLASELGIQNRVQMLGSVPEDSIRDLYERSLASLSPGYVGLSITQSLGFGVPMIYSKDEPHSGEIICAKPTWNSLTFHTDSPEDFGKVMLKMTRERELWIDRAPEISADCRQKYSIESMAQGFVEAIRELDKS